MTEDTVKVPKFDGKNFGLWKRQMEIALKVLNLAHTIEERAEVDGIITPKIEERDDVKVMSKIYGALEPQVLQKVVSCNNASEIWKRLKQIYENTSPASVGKVLESYYSYRKSGNDDMSTHISKIEAMALQLESLNQKQTNESIMSRLLHSLPSEYSLLKEAWESVSPQYQTKDHLISRMIAHQVNSDTVDKVLDDVALVARGTDKNTRRTIDKSKIRCYACGKLGHYKRDCRSASTGQINGRTGGQNIALVLNNHGKNDRWVIDSGASRHVCCRLDWFAELKDYQDKLRVGNDQWVEAKGIGTITIDCAVGNKIRTIDLRDVLYIPEMGFNLLSTSCAAERGGTTTINSTGCQIKMKNEVIALGEIDRNNGLCLLTGRVRLPPSPPVALISTRKSLGEWHRVLGHADHQAIEEMATNRIVEGLEVAGSAAKTPNCGPCAEGKATRAPHTVATSFRLTEVGDRVHIDLIGPTGANSLGNARYILLAKDGYSGYSHVGLLQKKSQVCHALQDYVGRFEAQSGRRIRSILTDNGTEFNNNAVRTLMQVEHIELLFSATYTAEQNGAAERNNRTIINTARTMLADSKLPLSLWGEAVSTAVFIRNRVIRRGAKSTPFEMFMGRKPYVGHLVPFGTQAHCLIKDRRLEKFDPRTEECFIVGFTERSNTYRAYTAVDQKVKITCDIIFRNHRNVGDREVNVSTSSDKVIDLGSSRSKDNLQVLFDDMVGVYPNIPETSHVARRGVGMMTSTPAAPRGRDEPSEISSPSYSELTTVTKTADEIEPAIEPINHVSLKLRETADRFETAKTGEISQNLRDDEDGDNNAGNGSEIILLARGEVASEPSNYEEAISGPNRNHWKEAIMSELSAHQTNETWSVVKRPGTGTLITSKWVFKHKFDAAGNIERFKARLVARGFQQTQGINYSETFAPVTKIESIRTIIAIAATKKLHLERFDVSTAFLNGKLEECVYLEAPEGIDLKTDECLKLNRALYGLKQAPRVWNSLFDAVLRSLGFKPTWKDPCVYVRSKDMCIVAIYVDDGLVVAPEGEKCIELIEHLNKHFETKRVNGELFLGMQVVKTSGGFHVNQAHYARDILKRFNMSDCAPVSVPMVDINSLTSDVDEVETSAPYRAAIGCLMWLAHCTRPDLVFTVTLLSRFCERPKQVHWAAVKRVLRYIRGTLNVGLNYTSDDTGKIIIEAYSDSDWAGSAAERKSTSGVVVNISSGPVIFSSRQQSICAQSTAEAEFIAANEATKEICWLVSLLTELGVKYEVLLVVAGSAMNRLRAERTCVSALAQES